MVSAHGGLAWPLTVPCLQTLQPRPHRLLSKDTPQRVRVPEEPAVRQRARFKEPSLEGFLVTVPASLWLGHLFEAGRLRAHSVPMLCCGTWKCAAHSGCLSQKSSAGNRGRTCRDPGGPASLCCCQGHRTWWPVALSPCSRAQGSLGQADVPAHGLLSDW